MKINFSINDGELRHTCRAKQEGEWIVFTCPHCKGFERRINFHTGKMKTRPAENPDVLHIGNFQQAGSDIDLNSRLN